MKYLFCTDGSKISFDALGKALSLVKSGATIDIFHVIHQNFLLQKLHPDKNFDEKYKKILKKIKDKTRKIINEHAHFEGQYFFEHGNDNKIVEYLQVNPYDLVIVGSHGYKGLRNQIGSTSRKIVQKSPHPVFISRPEINGEIHQNDKKKFLICVDEGFQSFFAIESFINIFDIKNVEISVLTVSADVRQYPIEIASDSVWIKACLEAEDKTAKEVLAKAQKIFSENNIEVKEKVHLKGDVSDEILSYVKSNFQDMLIFGSHSRQGLADFLLGSTSKRILDYCANSILIIPAKR